MPDISSQLLLQFETIMTPVGLLKYIYRNTSENYFYNKLKLERQCSHIAPLILQTNQLLNALLSNSKVFALISFVFNLWEVGPIVDLAELFMLILWHWVAFFCDLGWQREVSSARLVRERPIEGPTLLWEVTHASL